MQTSCFSYDGNFYIQPTPSVRILTLRPCSKRYTQKSPKGPSDSTCVVSPLEKLREGQDRREGWDRSNEEVQRTSVKVFGKMEFVSRVIDLNPIGIRL